MKYSALEYSVVSAGGTARTGVCVLYVPRELHESSVIEAHLHSQQVAVTVGEIGIPKSREEEESRG